MSLGAAVAVSTREPLIGGMTQAPLAMRAVAVMTLVEPWLKQLVLAEIMDGPPNCIFTVVFLFKYCCLSLNTLHGFQVSNAFLLQVISWTRMSRSGTWRG